MQYKYKKINYIYKYYTKTIKILDKLLLKKYLF